MNIVQDKLRKNLNRQIILNEKYRNYIYELQKENNDLKKKINDILNIIEVV